MDDKDPRFVKLQKIVNILDNEIYHLGRYLVFEKEFNQGNLFIEVCNTDGTVKVSTFIKGDSGLQYITSYNYSGLLLRASLYPAVIRFLKLLKKQNEELLEDVLADYDDEGKPLPEEKEE